MTNLQKGRPRLDKENYRPVNILNGFSKIYERFAYDSLAKVTDNFFSHFIATYRTERS